MIDIQDGEFYWTRVKPKPSYPEPKWEVMRAEVSRKMGFVSTQIIFHGTDETWCYLDDLEEVQHIERPK